MNAMLESLREIHRIHRQLSDLRDRLERGPRQIKAHEGNVTRLSAAVDDVHAQAKAAKVLADQKQLQLRTAENKIKELEDKLNQATSNREYQVLKDQIAADKMACSVLSDEIIEALEKIDGFKPLVAEAEANRKKAQEELAKASEAVRQQVALVQGDVQRLEGELAEAEKSLPDDVRDAYQRVVKSKGADAMAAVEGDVCGGCYQQLTPNNHNALRMGKLVFCLSCGRLLYLPEGVEGKPGR
ncbi:MAG: phospholipase [Pirellulales bacterium]|nr:phospholipase [Pirellulales bacterium]